MLQSIRKLILAAGIATTPIPSTAQDTSCLENIATEKVEVATDIAEAFRNTEHPVLVPAAGAIIEECEDLDGGDITTTGFDRCFSATWNAFTLADLRPTELDERWESVAKRYNTFKESGICLPEYNAD